jgi:hypothetical protein
MPDSADSPLDSMTAEEKSQRSTVASRRVSHWLDRL